MLYDYQYYQKFSGEQISEYTKKFENIFSNETLYINR